MSDTELDLDELEALENAWALISQAKMDNVASVISAHSQAMGFNDAFLVNETIRFLLLYHAAFPQLIARLRAAEARVKELEAACTAVAQQMPQVGGELLLCAQRGNDHPAILTVYDIVETLAEFKP